jgi:preprotein translocase subunit SecG
MTVVPFLAAGILMRFAEVLFVLISVVLILVVLIQKGRGGGLSGALGGGMASGLLGSKTGDFLTWATIVVVGVFLLLAVFLAKFDRPRIGEYGAEPTTTELPAPAEQPADMGTPAAPRPAPAQPGPVGDANATGG